MIWSAGSFFVLGRELENVGVAFMLYTDGKWKAEILLLSLMILKSGKWEIWICGGRVNLGVVIAEIRILWSQWPVVCAVIADREFIRSQCREICVCHCWQFNSLITMSLNSHPSLPAWQSLLYNDYQVYKCHCDQDFFFVCNESLPENIIANAIISLFPMKSWLITSLQLSQSLYLQWQNKWHIVDFDLSLTWFLRI